MDRVAGIWLDANLRAHCFIPPQYWKSNFDPVKEMLPRAEVYVYENDREIWGFIGLYRAERGIYRRHFCFR